MRNGLRSEVIGLCTRLKECRIRVNLSREQVAELIDMSKSTVADYEIGHRQPSLPILVILARLYGVSTDYLLNVEKSSPPSPLDTEGLNPEQIEALRHLIRVMKNQ